MHPCVEVNDVLQYEIEKRDISTLYYHCNCKHYSRITQFLVTAESFLFRVPRPRAFLQLDLHFAEEVFNFGDHLNQNNIQHPMPNVQLTQLLPFRIQSSILKR